MHIVECYTKRCQKMLRMVVNMLEFLYAMLLTCLNHQCYGGRVVLRQPALTNNRALNSELQRLSLGRAWVRISFVAIYSDIP